MSETGPQSTPGQSPEPQPAPEWRDRSRRNWGGQKADNWIMIGVVGILFLAAVVGVFHW